MTTKYELLKACIPSTMQKVVRKAGEDKLISAELWHNGLLLLELMWAESCHEYLVRLTNNTVWTLSQVTVESLTKHPHKKIPF